MLSGKFDLIAYADPELNLEDKKDMFNEELDLGESVEEKEGGERRDGAGGPKKTDSHAYLIGQMKQEVHDGANTEARDGASVTQHPAPQPGLGNAGRPPRPPGAEAASSDHTAASTLLSKVRSSVRSSSLILNQSAKI